MKNYLMIIFLISFSSPIFSQGGWNIGYVDIDSIDNEDIGRIVKVDFVHDWQDKIKPSKEGIFKYRRYILTKDTCELDFGDEKIQFVEHRKIYPDQGLFRHQFIESINTKQYQVMRLYDAVISKINEDKIKFIFLVKEFWTNKRNKLSERSCYLKSVWIEKKLLDGVMFQE